MDSYGLSMNALFGFKKEVEKNEMVDCCRRGACVPALIWTLLLYCGRGKRGQAVRGTEAERQIILSFLSESEKETFLNAVGLYHLFTDQYFYNTIRSVVGKKIYEELRK